MRLQRPKTARAVTRSVKTLEEYGRNLRDWFHELKRLSSRAALLEAVKVRPSRLAGQVEGGRTADAFLAAQVEYLCVQAGVAPPKWVQDPCYQLEDPWFSVSAPAARGALLRDTPASFKNRNLFTSSEVEIVLRRGRPKKSAAERRASNAERQRRFRKRRRKES